MRAPLRSAAKAAIARPFESPAIDEYGIQAEFATTLPRSAPSYLLVPCAVEVHGHSFLSNHYHLLVSVLDALQLAAFMNYFNSNLAREAGRLVRWREKFWGRRYQAILVSDEEEVQVSRLAYLLAHGV